LARADAPSELAQRHLQTGLAYERLSRLDDAYTELQLAANLDPNDGQMALAVGVVAIRLQRDDEAQRSLEHAVVLDANSSASYYELALLYEKKGLADRAVECWKRFANLNQDPALKAEAQRHVMYLEMHP